MSNARTARVAISAVFLVNGALLGTWAPFIPEAQRQLHLSNQSLGLALLASPIGAVLTMPLAGGLIHRYGSQRLARISGILMCLVIPWLMWANSLTALMVTLGMLGVVNGQMDVSMNTHSVAVQRLFNRPILSAVHGWFSIGGVVGGGASAIALKVGAEPVAYLAAMSAVLGGTLLVAGRHLLPSSTDRDAEGPRIAIPRGATLVLGLLVMASMISEGALWNWAAVFMRQARGANPATAALAFTLGSVAMSAGRLFGDPWIHRYGARWILGLSGALTGIGLLLAVALPSSVASMVGFCVVGLGLANLVPILFRAAGNLPGITAGNSLAAVSTCGYTGFLLGPPVIGLIAERTSLALALGSAGLLGLVVGAFGPRQIPDFHAEE